MKAIKKEIQVYRVHPRASSLAKKKKERHRNISCSSFKVNCHAQGGDESQDNSKYSAMLKLYPTAAEKKDTAIDRIGDVRALLARARTLAVQLTLDALDGQFPPWSRKGDGMMMLSL